MKGNCTHLSLYSTELAASKIFYIDYLQCTLIRYAEAEGTLVVDMGEFRLVFSKPRGDYGENFSAKESTVAAIDHIGYEFSHRSIVDDICAKLTQSSFIYAVLTSQDALQNSPATGPYRFYVTDPNGYTIEVHSWEDCDAE